MKPTYPPPGKQKDKVLRVLLAADGQWVSGKYFVRELYLTQFHTRIFELENDHHWNIEHSDFKDEHGFLSYRIVREPQTEQLFANEARV